MSGTTPKKGTVPKKVVSQGLAEIVTQQLNETHSGYESEVVKWEGHHALTVTPSQQKMLLASGDDPAWGEVKGAVICDLELKIYAIPVEMMSKLLSVEYSEEEGVSMSSDAPNINVGLMATIKETRDGVKTRNKTILYKTSWDLPETSNETISEDNVAVADLTIKGKAYPVFYSKADGSQGNKTVSIFNSVKQRAKWEANETSIQFPSDIVATEPTTPEVED